MRVLPFTLVVVAMTVVAACAGTPSTRSTAPLACDDSIRTSFKPDAATRVVAVRAIKKGETLTAVDAPTPVTAAIDMCLVKLLVGPGFTAEKNKDARSYSEGIGIEVWLPAHAQWNERIRDYGGGGWVGGGHRDPVKIGSKVPAIVNANMGYVSGTTDAGQPHYQDGSFIFLSDGRVNVEGMRDFSVRAMVEQATKTKALAAVYYGKPARHTYFDGHSQGGRQGLKVAQEYPELYDGYMIAQPAISIPRFGSVGLYPQLVMKKDLGFTAVDKPKAAAFAKKVAEATKRAVQVCDKTGLGFLLDPFACNYDPAKDAQLLCTGVTGAGGEAGRGADPATCMSLVEANALNRIWYGATIDGSWDAGQSDDGRAGRALGAKQLWWGFAKGTTVGGITGAGADQVALAMHDVRYVSTPPPLQGFRSSTRRRASATSGSSSSSRIWPMYSGATSRRTRSLMA